MLQQYNVYPNWINIKEKKSGNYKVIEVTEIDDSREKIEYNLKKTIVNHYTLPEILDYHLVQINDRFNNLEQYLTNRIPNEERIRKGEFGEIFGTEHLKQRHNYHFPVYRLRKKDNKNAPVHGEDIFGFKYKDNEISCLCICESKVAKQYKTKVLNKACEQLKESNINPKSLMKFHEELWNSDKELSIKIFNVSKEITTIKKENWIFYIIENKSIKIFKEHECLNSLENLKLVYFHINDLTEFVNKLYDECGDIFND